jgi:hypothetical protein
VLEAIKVLKASSHWRAELLNRNALEELIKKRANGDQSLFEDELAQRHEKGLFIGIDYAETRIPQLERLINVLAETSPAGPVRIVMLARTNTWWRGFLDRLSDEQRKICDQEPFFGIGTEFAIEHRHIFFAASCVAFSEELRKLDFSASRTHDITSLLGQDWMNQEVDRAAIEGSGNPLLLAFQAYLHVRDRPVTMSPLAEMAQEERRHISRALGSRAPLAS